MKIPRIIRENFWFATIGGLLVFELHLVDGRTGAEWFGAGVGAAITLWAVAELQKAKPRPIEWRPADYPETVGDLVTGDVFFLAPSPARSERSRMPDHPLIAGEPIGGSIIRGVTSMTSGQTFGLEPDRRVRRVQARVEVSVR